jgi:plastocyanin
MVATASAQTTYELTNSGTTFSPDLITMQAGDSIHLVLASPHTCTEVSQATWNANGNTSNGGFNFPSGTHTFSLDVPGTYYYVCIPHASMGMKGQIIVTASTVGVQETAAAGTLQTYPNPASNAITLSGVAAGLPLTVVDADGRTVLETVTSTDGKLDVSMLQTGSYTLMVKDGTGKPNMQTRLLIAR